MKPEEFNDNIESNSKFKFEPFYIQQKKRIQNNEENR